MSLLDTASLLLTPNAYKEGKLYSVIPSDGSGDFTFTRATTATRVNSDGLVELVPYNLLQRSEEFDNAVWVKTNVTVSANTTSSPSGVSDADKLNETAISGTHRLVLSPITLVSGTAYTLSLYVKAAERTRCALRFSDGVSTKGIGFDLSTQTTFGLTSGELSPTSSSIESVGNGWYRILMTSTSSGTSGNYQIHTMDSGTSTSFVGVLGDGLYLWGAQLVEGSAALPYQKTETRLNIPRLDYSNGTCPSILLEPQRTNLLLQSSSFDNAYWTKTNGVLTVNNTTAPDGTLTADLFTETTFTNSSASVGNSSLISVTSGVAYTTTIYAKKGNDKYLYLSNYYNSANKYYTLIVDLESGTITKEQAGSSITSFSSSITSVGDGWYRISLTQTTASTQLYFILRISNSATPTIDASYGFITIPSNNNRSLYLWGAQLEAGSYATSYIPTTTASVTRNAEVCSKTGISSLIGQTQGTLYFELKDFVEKDIPCITIDDGTNNNRFLLFREPPTGRYGLFVSISGVIYATYSTISENDGKFAIAYNGSGFVVYRNGVQIITSTNAVPNNLSAIRLNGRATNDLYTLKKVYATALWKTRLTDDQLAQLTSL